MEKQTLNLFIEILKLKQSLEAVEKIIREEQRKEVENIFTKNYEI